MSLSARKEKRTWSIEDVELKIIEDQELWFSCARLTDVRGYVLMSIFEGKRVWWVGKPKGIKPISKATFSSTCLTNQDNCWFLRSCLELHFLITYVIVLPLTQVVQSVLSPNSFASLSSQDKESTETNLEIVCNCQILVLPLLWEVLDFHWQILFDVLCVPYRPYSASWHATSICID